MEDRVSHVRSGHERWAPAGHRLRRRATIAGVTVMATMAAAIVGARSSQASPYCEDLKQITNLAMTYERFSSIIGTPREGNYRDAKLVLTGWKDCSFYGRMTYNCESQPLKTTAEAERAQARIAEEIVTCLGTWAEDKEQSSSSNFVVLHPALGPASITLNLDETDTGEHVVRLILFLRR